MPATPWGPNDRPLLTGAFGSFQSAALAGLSTSEVWSKLREVVGQWAFSTSGAAGTPTVSELEDTGREILSQQGIGIQQVNTYRALAGQWRGAKERIASLDQGAQIDAAAIFRPPWAATAGPAVPSQYRARVNWQITPSSGDVFTRWSTYTLTTPLMSKGDVLAQATASMEDDKYLQILSGGAPVEALEFQVEEV